MGQAGGVRGGGWAVVEGRLFFSSIETEILKVPFTILLGEKSSEKCCITDGTMFSHLHRFLPSTLFLSNSLLVYSIEVGTPYTKGGKVFSNRKFILRATGNY